jgi:hypothetical protein
MGKNHTASILAFIALLCVVIPRAHGMRNWSTGPQDEGYEWWSLRTRELPPFDAVEAPLYLAALARAFNGAGAGDRPRFRFYITDTLNTAVWAQGDGHFIIHGGLLARVKDHLTFNFILALEMAHDVLGHGATDTRVTPVPLLTGLIFSDGSADLWDLDGFAWLATFDPVRKSGRAYTLREEEQALSLVSVFFTRMGWDYDAAARAALLQIQDFSQWPGGGDLGALHKEIGVAVRLPRPEGKHTPSSEEALVNADAFAKLRDQLLKRTRQKYSWLIEAAPYASILRQGGGSLEGDLKAFEGRRAALGSPLSPTAEAWVRGRIHLNHDNFTGALSIAEEALQKRSPTEPVLLQRLQAGLFTQKAQHCKDEVQQDWARADYVRGRYHVLCLLSDGELTAAAEASHKLRADYPNDPQAAFLEAVALARLRRPFGDLIKTLEKDWGGRPGLKALKLLHAAQNRDWKTFQDLAGVGDEALYGAEENGILDFARAWGYGVRGDGQSHGHLNRAANRWFPARVPERILPYFAP